MTRSGVSDRTVAYNLATCSEEAGNFRAASEAYESVYRMVFHTPLQGTGGAPVVEANYDMEEWAEIRSESLDRVRRRYEAEERLVVLTGPPSM